MFWCDECIKLNTNWKEKLFCLFDTSHSRHVLMWWMHQTLYQLKKETILFVWHISFKACSDVMNASNLIPTEKRNYFVCLTHLIQGMFWCDECNKLNTNWKEKLLCLFVLILYVPVNTCLTHLIQGMFWCDECIKLNTNWKEKLFCLFDLVLYVPVKKISVMLGRFFRGWTSTKQGLMCHAQGHDTMTWVRLEPMTLRSWVKRSTTEPLRSQ